MWAYSFVIAVLLGLNVPALALSRTVVRDLSLYNQSSLRCESHLLQEALASARPVLGGVEVSLKIRDRGQLERLVEPIIRQKERRGRVRRLLSSFRRHIGRALGRVGLGFVFRDSPLREFVDQVWWKRHLERLEGREVPLRGPSFSSIRERTFESREVHESLFYQEVDGEVDLTIKVFVSGRKETRLLEQFPTPDSDELRPF